MQNRDVRDMISMDFGDDLTSCYEQRMCQLDSGVIVSIGWNENTKRLENHYTYLSVEILR